MLSRWLPWRFLVRRAARAHGFFDPLTLLAQLRRFAQPSEVAEPVELLREGIRFHARGLVNTKAIQHNLDWVWPYWIERQFNPRDPSFIPRGFSFSHINLTHRDWTAVGLPDRALYPIVDPRGLVTPLHDGWSLDVWIEDGDGRRLLPSRAVHADQRLLADDGLAVATRVREDGLQLSSRVLVAEENGAAVLRIEAAGIAPGGGRMIVSLRPYNPEGIQFVHEIRYDGELDGWRVDGDTPVAFDAPPDAEAYSDYAEGDVADRSPGAEGPRETTCRVGMATAAAYFDIDAAGHRRVSVRVPLEPSSGREAPGAGTDGAWRSARGETARLSVPDDRIRSLYDAAVSTLLLLSADDIVPGPFTYRRFWFRDACMMLNGLMSIGALSRCRRALDRFPDRQKRDGYFQSQSGEWDANGQVLWAAGRFQRLSGEPPSSRLLDALFRGARWIERKRTPPDGGLPHSGLLPAGFSAEHLGPNDFYYWDDYWALGGLEALARLARTFRPAQADRVDRLAAGLAESIAGSRAAIPERRSRGAIPASPYRRLDSGAVGSLVADYPLRLVPPGDAAIRKTVDFLLERCFVNGAFFQDMVHSGLNAYLTLAIAQTLLRAGDPRYENLVRRTAGLASPTGQWPEAVHPATRGGCMGDGQHGWAAAEWVAMVRSLFVREEGEELVVGSGVFADWIRPDGVAAFGPTPTPHGPVAVRIASNTRGPTLSLSGPAGPGSPRIRIAVPGYREIREAEPDGSYRLES